MDTGGGFVLPRTKGDDSRRRGENEEKEDLHNGANGEGSSSGARAGPLTSVERRKLSSKQEMRLVAFLDDQFLALIRGFNKRHEPASSLAAPAATTMTSMRRVQDYLEAAERILAIITSIPPVGPSAALLVSYLLRFTGDTVDAIQGYETGESADAAAAEEEEKEQRNGGGGVAASAQLDLVLWFMLLLDKVWAGVLRGHVVDYKTIKRRATLEVEGRKAGSRIERIIDGRFTSVFANGSLAEEGEEGEEVQSESKPLVGGKGTSTVGQTDRIRLRNVAVGAREGLFAWMRQQLNRPIPPRIEEEEEEEEEEEKENEEEVALFQEQGDAEQEAEAEEFKAHNNNGAHVIVKQEEQDDDQDEGDMEEVDVDRVVAEEDDDLEEEPAHSHYDDLFARKIELDESEEEEYEDDGGTRKYEDDEKTDVVRERQSKSIMKSGSEGGNKRDLSPSSSMPPPKRRAYKTEEDDDDDNSEFGNDGERQVSQDAPSPTSSSQSMAAPTLEMESAASFSGTEAANIMQWDSRFSQVLSRTLRLLSDIQDTKSMAQRAPARSALQHETDS